MAWIESHQSLKEHPKTKRLVRALGVPLPTVIGHLHLMWWYCLDYAPDGDLSFDRFGVEDIADMAGWTGDAHVFVDALERSGFLEKEGDRLLIHDWDDYAGKLIERRETNAARMREARAAKEKPRARHVQRTSKTRADTCGATVPYPTEQNTTEPGIAKAIATAEPPHAPMKPITPHAALVMVLAETEGGMPGDTLSGAEWSRLGKVAKSLIAAGATPSEIRLRADRYKRGHPDWEYTANALENRWGSLAAEPVPRGSPNGRAEPVTFQGQIATNNHRNAARFIEAVERHQGNGQQDVRDGDGQARRVLPHGG